MSGVVLAGTRSGVGKTTAALATLRALDRAGYEPRAAKAGPDFVDPSHHEQVVPTPSRTLDPWLQGTTGTRRNYHRGAGEETVCVVEGMMGLYDGSATSTASVAAALDLPVILVVDAKAGMESVAATALGFREYADRIGREVDVAGVLVQRAHGGRHETGIRDALPDELRYFGRIPPDEDLAIPDRHLGLHMGSEIELPDGALDRAAETVDAEAVAAIARDPPEPEPLAPPERRDVTVAVARGPAFPFVYPATLERLRDRATVAPFAPTEGDALPDCDGVYLPGGYPELHGPALADAPALDAVGERAADGLPVLGECGGLMALTDSLTTTDGETHAMAGALPGSVTMRDRYQALDHVELRARRDAPTASEGETLRGHEFHYSEASVPSDARFAFDVERGDGIGEERDGYLVQSTLGTYAHVHPESGAFDAFVDAL